jgi:hypothetical protein
VVDRFQQFQPFFLPESDDSRMGYGLSIASHIIVVLLLMFGVFERIELFPVAATPVEIVMEKPAEAARQDAPDHPSAIPVADVDKQAKALLAVLNVNGIDRPKQPGSDGRDPSMDQAGIPVPPPPDADTGLVSGGVSDPSRAMVLAPIGPAPPQTTARQPGEDEWTAVKEQKIECGVRATEWIAPAATRGQAKVKGVATEAQALAITRLNQSHKDRRVNPSYMRNQVLFAESMDGVQTFVVLIPSGLTVNVGDVIQFDGGHIDPSDSCQYIPNLAVKKL